MSQTPNSVPLPNLWDTVEFKPEKDYRAIWCPLVPDGSRYVQVRLKCGAVAVLDHGDWVRITEKYGASFLMWKQMQSAGTKYEAEHVYTSVPEVGILRTPVRVAQLVAKAHWRTTISYIDHDPRNLTRANLRVGVRRDLRAYHNHHHQRTTQPPTKKD